MLNRFALLCALVALPGSSQAILLGNHQITLDILGTTNYFEFANFLEHQFPIQGLDWGYRFLDLGDIEFFDPDIGAPDNPLQNRNRIRMSFEGNLDIGARLRSAISPKWGIEGYIKYSPVNLVILHNSIPVPEANFTRYSGVQNPNDAFAQWVWKSGDYPTYHIIRFGANLDYTYFRSEGNTVNSYVSAGAGVVSYFRTGELLVPADSSVEHPDIPAAPIDASYYMPNDKFLSVNFGFGGIVFLHRLFGLNADLRTSYTPFKLERMGFDSQNHWIVSGSIGYTIRLG